MTRGRIEPTTYLYCHTTATKISTCICLHIFILLFHSVQAPRLPWPALKGAGPTVLACVLRTSAKPVRGDFTARQLASLNQAESAAEGGHCENEYWFNCIHQVSLRWKHLIKTCLKQMVQMTRGCEGWWLLDVTVDHHHSSCFMEELKVLLKLEAYIQCSICTILLWSTHWKRTLLLQLNKHFFFQTVKFAFTHINWQ